MKVLIAGGSGMIGKALTQSLLAGGHQVWILTRHPDASHLPVGTSAIAWDGTTCAEWGEIIFQMDVVVNLVGESLSKWPWTARQKQRFWDSRVNGGRALVEAIQAASPRPKVFIQASGSNYYGTHDLKTVDEKNPPGEDFLSRLSIAWENSTKPVEEMGVRRVIIRSGIVLSRRDGILPLMMLPMRLFLGGAMGSGRQGVPWIHLEDEVRVIRFLIDDPEASGPFNLTSPIPVSNADFFYAAAKELRLPFWLHIPTFALKMILGELATLIVEGMYLVPSRLMEMGYQFRFVHVVDAIGDLYKGY